MGEDKFGSGSISNQGGFKSSTPQERFTRQLERDIKRDRLSQSTLRKLITDDTAQWARNIYAEKAAQNAAINTLNTQNQSRQIVGVIKESGGGVSGDTQVAAGLVPTSSASASASPVEFPEGGGTGGCNGLQLYTSGSNVFLTAAPIAGEILPDFQVGVGMPLGTLSPTRFVWAEITIDGETGEITEVEIKTGSNAPEYVAFSQNKAAYIIGRISASGIENFGCGGIDVTICRNWYRNVPPYYGISMVRNPNLLQ